MPNPSSAERTAAATVTQPSFFHGSRSVGTGAVKLTDTPTPLAKGVTIRAAKANTGNVHVGKDTNVTTIAAEASDGFELAAQESLTIEVDDASKVWLIATVAAQRVFWAGV